MAKTWCQAGRQNLRDPYLVAGDQSQTWATNALALGRELGIQPSWFRDKEEINFLVFFSVQPATLPQLLSERLILHIVQHEV